MRASAVLCAALALGGAAAFELRGSVPALDAAQEQSPALLSVMTEIKAGSPADRIVQLLDSVIGSLEKAQEVDAAEFKKTNADCEQSAGRYRREFTSASKELQGVRDSVATAKQTVQAKKAQISALNDEILSANQAAHKIQEVRRGSGLPTVPVPGAPLTRVPGPRPRALPQQNLDQARTTFQSSAAAYRKNRNHIAEAKSMVQAILKQLSSGADAKPAEGALLQLSAHLSKAGLHEDAKKAAALEPSVEDKASSLEAEMEDRAKELLGDVSGSEEVEAEVKAMATGATGAAGMDDTPVTSNAEAQRMIDLVTHLLNRLHENEQRQIEEQKEAEASYQKLTSKMQASLARANERKNDAMEKRREAQQALDKALAVKAKHSDTVDDAATAAKHAEAAYNKDEALCRSYRRQFESRTKDREADIETAKTLRTLVREKLNSIRDKLEQAVAPASTGAEGTASA